MMRRFALPALMLLTASPALAAEPRTAAAVIAADDSWLKAEVEGDAAALDQLLLPEYVSVGTSGKVTGKAKLVANAKARSKDDSVKLAASVAQWKAAHPTRPEVTIVGDTAVLKWVISGSGEGDPVSSCDVFVYRDGRWRALYSQHSTASS